MFACAEELFSALQDGAVRRVFTPPNHKSFYMSANALPAHRNERRPASADIRQPPPTSFTTDVTTPKATHARRWCGVQL